jgi:superfamily II DNA or RNA helicase
MKLYAHQQKIIDEDPKKAGLFLGTGSGKTRIALLLARGSVLVIAPKTQVEDKNWQRELTSLVDPVYTAMFLTVISKETFRRDHATLPAFDTVIVDEAHTCLGVTANVRWVKKQPRPKASLLFEALQAYIARTAPERLYLCTATIMRSPMTVWAAAELLNKEWDWYKFRSTFYYQLPMPGREVWQAKSTPEIKDRLAAAVRSLGYTGRLDDFFDVPEQSFITKYVELTGKQKDRIKDMKMEYPEPLVRVGKIHQIENGVLAGDEFNKPESFDSNKIETILDLASEFPRMVIFCKYSEQIQRIGSALRYGADRKILILEGATKDRGAVIAEANAAKECIVIAQAQISAGWELPEYPVMVFASRTYSWVDYDQAIGRIQRANNIKKNLYINLVVKGGVDEAVDKAITNKKDFNERIYVGL